MQLVLGEATYAAIRHLPLAVELVRKSRQQLVSHLDSYCNHHNDLFSEVCLASAECLYDNSKM